MKKPFIILFFILGLTTLLSAQCKFEVGLSGQDIKCYGDFTGSVQVTIDPVNGFSGPYIIRWFDDDNRAFRDDLPAGTHFVKVTDAEGCFLNEFITLEEPDELILEFIKEDALCFNESNGNIDLIVSGGVMPYSYQWSNGETTEDLSNIPSGTYTGTVTDANFCSTTIEIEIDQPDQLGISESIIPASCVDSEDGIIKTVVFGGVIPYVYTWDSGQDIPNITDLVSGNYTLTVTDGNGCTVTETYFVPEPPAIQIGFDVDEVSCYLETDGAITAFVSGGTPDYRYQWSNTRFVLGDTTTNPTGLGSDYYKLQITDFNGCIEVDSVELKQPNPFVVNLDATPATCFDKPDGSINLSVSGGRTPYAFLWSNSASTEDINQLLSDTYSVVVTDQTGCSQYGEILVDQPDSLDFQVVINEVSCKDEDDGQISINPAGGTEPYTVDWSFGGSDFQVNDLDGGTYDISLTDNNSCLYSASFEVVINPQPCITSVLVPSAFSPNGDGINDLWLIESYEVYPQLYLEVFSNWGAKVFSSKGYENPWDGTKNGRELPAGTYYYVIDLGNSDPVISGFVTLVR